MVSITLGRRGKVATTELSLSVNKENGILSTGAVKRRAGVQYREGIRIKTRCKRIWKLGVEHNEKRLVVTEEFLKERQYK